MYPGDVAQRRRIGAFGRIRLDRRHGELDAGFQGWCDTIEHGLHDHRDTGHDDHIGDAKTRNLVDRIGHQIAALRHARHAPARGVEILRLDACQHGLDDALVFIKLDPEGLRHRIGGDVIMRRADAARGEDIGVADTQRIQRRDNVLHDIGHDAHFAQVDTDIGHVIGDVADVLVLGPSRQDLVADDKHGSGHGRGLMGGLV